MLQRGCEGWPQRVVCKSGHKAVKFKGARVRVPSFKGGYTSRRSLSDVCSQPDVSQKVSTVWDGARRAFRAEARRYRSMVRRQSFVKARHGCRTARWDHDPAMLGSEVRESGSQTVKRRPDFAREALGARLSLSAIPGG